MRSLSLSRVTLGFASLAAAAFAPACRSAPGVRPTTAGAALAVGGAETRGEARLANGVRVVIEENHAAPVASVQVWVAAGAADDPPALEGTAHLIQRLVLAGSARHPAGLSREVAALGGTAGAWTGPDETVFHAAVAAAQLAPALDLLADALAAPAFDEAALARARRQVMDGLAIGTRDPARRASDALLASAFAGGRYAAPLAGREAAIAARTRAELIARHAERYVGGAMTVVVVGDVDAAAARAQVGRAFGAIRSGDGPALTAVAAPGPGRVTVVAGRSGGLAAPAQIALGVRTARLAVEDAAAVDLLAAALARGPSSRVTRTLVQRRQVATDARAYTFCGRGAGLLALSIVPAARRIEEAADAAIGEVLRLGREELSAEELSAARVAVETDMARGEEGIEGHARRLGYAAAIAGNLDHGARYRDRLRALTPATLRETAARLLRADALALAVVLPDGAPAGRDETEAALRPRLEALVSAAGTRTLRSDGLATAAVPAGATAGGGDLVRAVAPSGLRVIVLRDSSAPRVTVAAAWAGGAQTEDDGSNGTAALLAALLGRGTRTRSAARLEAELADIGGSMAGFSDRASLGLRADFLAADWRRGLALVSDCLLRPSFSEDELDAQRRALLTRIRRAAASPEAPAAAAVRLFEAALWPRQGYRLDPLGTPEAVSALTRVRLTERYRRGYPIAGLAIAVVGDVDPATVVPALIALFGDAPPAAPLPAPAPPVAPARTEPFAVFQTQGEGEAHVVLGYPTVPPGDPDRPALEVLAEILGGDRGRLAIALRDAKLLAHDVVVRAAGPREPGYLAAVLTSAPARADEVVVAVRAELGRVAAAGVAADEVASAGRRLAGARAIALGSRAAVADALALDAAYGLDLHAYRGYPAALARVTAADVARAAKRVLDPQREIVAVVRPAETASRLVGAER